MKLLISFLFLAVLSFVQSCGNSEASGENQCGVRYVSGKECIVCSKGGVSCRWN
jgi:hypothetical protein